jgi:hypothetical protein
VLALFIDHEPDEPRALRASVPALRLDDKLPERPVHLAFEVHYGLPNANEEMQARTLWLGHLRMHAGALAALAVDRTEGETRDRAILVAERLGTLLKQGNTMNGDFMRRLDLAAPLPDMKPWPPVFAGEPPSQQAEEAMRPPLNWDRLDDVAAWARQVVYFLSGLHQDSSQPVQGVAVLHLRRLIDAAAQGLVTGTCAFVARPAAAAVSSGKTAPRKRRAKKGGAT